MRADGARRLRTRRAVGRLDTREPDGALADYLVQRARERGVLLSTDGPHHNVIKVKPPLVFESADAGRVVDLLDELLTEDFPRLRSTH